MDDLLLRNRVLDDLDIHIVLVGQVLILSSNLLLGGLQLLSLSHGGEDQVALDLTQRGDLSVLTELSAVGAHHLQILVKGEASALHTVLVVLDDAVSLILDHGLGNFHLGGLDQLGENSILEVLLSGLLTAGAQLLLQIGLQLIQGLKLRDVLGELIIQSGSLGLLDLVHLDLEHDRSTGQLSGSIILGEGDIDVLLLAGGSAHQLILEAGDEGTGTQLQGILLGLAALESDAVLEALKVDDNGVAILGRTLHGDLTGSAGDQGLHLVVNVLGSDGHLSLGGLNALVLAQHGHRTQTDGSLEGKAILAQLLHIDRGITHHVQTGLLDGLGQHNGIQVVDGILIEHVSAIHLLHQLAGGVALAEARQRDHTFILAINLFDSSVELLSAHLDGQNSSVLFFLFHILQIHWFLPPICPEGQNIHDA